MAATIGTIALVSLAAAGTASAIEANQQNKKAARARRQANAVATAEGKVQDINQRRHSSYKTCSD